MWNPFHGTGLIAGLHKQDFCGFGWTFFQNIDHANDRDCQKGKRDDDCDQNLKDRF